MGEPHKKIVDMEIDITESLTVLKMEDDSNSGSGHYSDLVDVPEANFGTGEDAYATPVQFQEQRPPFSASSSNNGNVEVRQVSRKSTAGMQNMGTDKEYEYSETQRQVQKQPKELAKLEDDLQFMENFDPENSSRNLQKRKKRYHHNDGRLVQYADDFEVCDCLRPQCPGCHLPCRSCGDRRCGKDCRVNRKWIYDGVEVEGRSLEFTNPNSTTFSS